MGKIKDTFERVFGDAVRGVREPEAKPKPANTSQKADKSFPRKSVRRVWDPRSLRFVEIDAEEQIAPDWWLTEPRKKRNPYSDGPGDPMEGWRRGLFETDLFKD